MPILRGRTLRAPDTGVSAPALAGRYPAEVAQALLGLAPFLILSTAALLVVPAQAADLGAGESGLQLAQGLSEAGYALGVVVAADLVRRVASRTLYLGCVLGLAAGSFLAAGAGEVVALTAGRAVQGFTTGILLVVALPPLITGYGGARVPRSVALMNVGLFGGSAFGATIGGLLAGPGQWRLLFAAMGVVALAAGVLGWNTFAHRDPPSPRMGFDLAGIPLAALATVLPFVGLSALAAGPALSPEVVVPIGVGLAALVALVVAQYRKEHPLMPARLIAHTLPVIGLVSAMLTGAGYTALVQLVVKHLRGVEHLTPPVVAAVASAQIVGLAVGVWLIAATLSTRWLPVLVLGGLAAVGLAGAVLAVGLGSAPVLAATAAAGLLGLGATIGVGPGLFLGALSVTSTRLGPAFALVQLLRAEAAFLLGPVLAQLASTGSLVDGVLRGSQVVAVAAAVGVVALTVLLLLGGSRPQSPDLDSWVDGDGPAYRSPPLAAVARTATGTTPDVGTRPGGGTRPT